MTVAVALFTRDLRVHDNPVLHAAVRSVGQVVPLFVLDERIVASRYNRPNRARFLAESLADLHTRLRELGAALVLRRGDIWPMWTEPRCTGRGNFRHSSGARSTTQTRSSTCTMRRNASAEPAREWVTVF